MKLVADSGLWSTGPLPAPPPLVAVLEVSGAVLAWTVDGSADGAVHLTFTDIDRADWLWRIFGVSGHVAAHSLTASAAGSGSPVMTEVELTEVDLQPGPIAALRRLALAHWLRRWWPASSRDGIAGLDPALLDAETAILTAAAQDYLAEDSLDSEIAALLTPHVTTLAARMRGGDPRIAELLRACLELAEDVGAGTELWPEYVAAQDYSPLFRADDYALAAGSDSRTVSPEDIAGGSTSIDWIAVPAGIFDAAEDTVRWSIRQSGSTAVAVVRTDILTSAGTPLTTSGIAVRLRSGSVTGAGVLDAEGRATFGLQDAARQSLSESAAWAHDWSATTVTVGADIEGRGAEPDEARAMRQRVRDFARSRLAGPGADAFLAEIVAAESDY